MNASTGDFHQEFVPIKNVINASLASLSLNMPMCVMVESRLGRIFSQRNLYSDERLKEALTNPNKRKIFKVIEGPWMGNYDNDHVESEKPLLLNKNTVGNRKGCNSVICSKQDVVRGMHGKPSRITVLNILHKLEHEDKTIDAIKKSNGQLYNLYVNKNNLTASLEIGLSNFENAYFLLLQKAKDKFEEKRRIVAKTTTRTRTDDEFILLTCMFSIYEDMIKTYFMRTFVIWPEETKNDNETLSKLYTILFSRLAKMQLKLLDALRTKSFVLPIIKNIILRSLELPKHIKPTLDYSKEYKLVKETEDTIDAVWKIASDLFHRGYDDHLEQYNLDEVKDWRVLLELRKQHPDLRKSMDNMNNSFLRQIDKSHEKTKNNDRAK